jgi:hypothetical protein
MSAPEFRIGLSAVNHPRIKGGAHWRWAMKRCAMPLRLWGANVAADIGVRIERLRVN